VSDESLILPDGYTVHPAAEVFPLMTGDEFDGLVESIRKQGVRNPVVYRGTVLLDGRNRLRAVQRLSSEGITVNVPSVQRDGDGADDIEWVESQNLFRRHLTDDAQAMVAAELWRLIGERTRAAQQASQFTTDTAKAAAKKKTRGAVDTKTCPPKKRDTKAKNAASAVGQVAAKGKVSHHKARMALEVEKAVESGDLAADVKGEIKAGKKKLKDVIPKKKRRAAGRQGDRKCQSIDDEIRNAAQRAWTNLRGKFTPGDEHKKLRAVLLEIIRKEQQQFGDIRPRNKGSKSDAGSASGNAEASAESAVLAVHAAIERVMKQGTSLHARCVEELQQHSLRLDEILQHEHSSTRRIAWGPDTATFAELQRITGYVAGIQGKPQKLFRAVRLAAQRARKALGN
jgi:hypothetical protein